VIDDFVRLVVAAAQRTNAGSGHGCHWAVSLVFIVVILGESTGQMVSERVAVGVAPKQSDGSVIEIQ
jgi:hypothetical protein